MNAAWIVAVIVVPVSLAVLGLVGHYWMERRRERRAEREEETKPGLDLLAGLTEVLDANTLPGSDALAKLSRQLWDVEEDAPGAMRPALVRVCGRLDSHRVAVLEGTSLLQAREDVRKAIKQAREEIWRYRRNG